jgi:DNA modification methylase/uncharacterized protein YbaR (Trm112 family)
MKLTKEDLDRVRHVEGFPIGKDEDIIELSRPPCYTACPNPFIGDFIKEHGKPYDEATDTYHREPFAADVSEGKNDPIYNAHSYHTKVPHRAIMRYILHYTEPGDIVFDGFCGTGMTGVAAQMCQSPDPEFRVKIEKDMPYVKWGARKAILNDLSPAATFIAANYNMPVDVQEFEREAKRILKECEKECGWMYETLHTDGDGETNRYVDGKPIKGRINYVVWSDVLVCPNCSGEIVFWDEAVDKEKGEVKDAFRCGRCRSELKKRDCERAKEIIYDKALKKNITMAKQVPVLINYSVGKKRYEKAPDEYDLDLLRRIDEMDIPYWYPTDRMPEGYNTEQPKRSHGITHVHHFYTKRNLWVLSRLWDKVLKAEIETGHLIFAFEQVIWGMSRLARYVPTHYSQVNQYLSGTLYIGSQVVEVTPHYILKNKINNLVKVFSKSYALINNSIISTNSHTAVNIIKNSIDYIFTDPPFGSNLMYSELNFLWEAWLKVFTNNKPEAIVNKVQKKGLAEYQELMEKCFAECYRVLKPGRWMTVEFHNSANSVWNSIQEALLRAGFMVADVSTLDKKQGTFKQVTTTSAVKQDLIISAYKPKEAFKRRFLEQAGSEEAAWDFVRQHLGNLPVTVESRGKLGIIQERQGYLLYDRMLAYHVVNGIPVPMDAADFYKGLAERFIERDGMYFLADQVNEYDDKRMKMEVEEMQLSMVVADEKSAIQWLYNQLSTPQTYQEIQPKFVKELHQLRYEKMPELTDMLEENFLQHEDGRWYVPDINKASDLAKLRKKRLLKEFEEYMKGTGRLKAFRTEAVRAGFDRCWMQRDFETIVKVAKRLPEKVVQEDPALLMYYDNAMGKVEA